MHSSQSSVRNRAGQPRRGLVLIPARLAPRNSSATVMPGNQSHIAQKDAANPRYIQK